MPPGGLAPPTAYLDSQLPTSHTIYWPLVQMDVKVVSTFFFPSCCQQYDLETIKDMYLEKYDVSLKDALRDECSGDFKRLLLAICHWGQGRTWTTEAETAEYVHTEGRCCRLSNKLILLSISMWHYIGSRRVGGINHLTSCLVQTLS